MLWKMWSYSVALTRHIIISCMHNMKFSEINCIRYVGPTHIHWWTETNRYRLESCTLFPPPSCFNAGYITQCNVLDLTINR